MLGVRENIEELTNIQSIKWIARLVFEPIPPGISREYKKVVYGHTYSLKDQFIAYCIKNSLVPKSIDRVEVQTMAFAVWWEYIYDDSESFVVTDERGREYFDFSKFLILFH